MLGGLEGAVKGVTNNDSSNNSSRQILKVIANKQRPVKPGLIYSMPSWTNMDRFRQRSLSYCRFSRTTESNKRNSEAIHGITAPQS